MTHRLSRRPRWLRLMAAASLAGLLAPPAIASETITYTYDARGRLVKVARSGNVNNGATACYAYDKADNRSNVTVQTTSDCSAGTGVSFAVSSNGAVTEGATSVFTVTKTGTATGTLTVNYGTSNGTAVQPGDYTTTTGTLSFLTSDTSKTINVPTVNDSTSESTEAFAMTLSAPSGGAILGTASTNGTINDDDAPPACSGVSFTIASNGAVTEGANSVFTVTKTGTATGSCSVTYATANGTAAAPGDYTTASNTLTFTSAQTSQTVNVTTINDVAVESAETFSMSLSSPTGGATLGTPNSATATINDNDGNQPPTAVNDTGSQQKCTTQIYNVTANDTDPEGNYPLVVTSVTGSGFSVYSSSEIEFTSTQSTGAKVGTYTVRDSLNATSTATLTVTVSGGTQCQ